MILVISSNQIKTKMETEYQDIDLIRFVAPLNDFLYIIKKHNNCT
jgi:hypothetical protein